ncbi:MAG: FAD-dependent oxidoreductase [Candidatus Rifleibacteriota bacterium]
MQKKCRNSSRVENLSDMEKGWSLTQAVNEASRCHLCHDAPCTKACPAGTNPAEFIRKLRLRNVKGAIRTIKQNNILGGICAVVCPTEQLCQKGCVAAGLDRAIDIGQIQRFLVEHGWTSGFNPMEKVSGKKGKVAVIGSGPAGLACAAEVASHGYQAEIFEGMEKPGGVLRYGVPSFRLNAEFLDREIKDVQNLGVKISCGKKIGDAGVEKLLEKGYEAVFYAPGAWKPVEIKIPGIELKNVYTARDFLAGVRTGEQKALARLVKGKNVAVYGGGSVAMDAATTAMALGANRVYLLYRRSFREMPASDHDVQMAMANNVCFRTMSVVTRLTGNEKGCVTGLDGLETDWKKPGDTSAANLITQSGTDFHLNIDLFISALGYRPETETRKACAKVKFNNRGLVETRKDGVSTSHPRIFSGGDIVRGPALVVEAVADGKAAGKKIVEMLDSEKGMVKAPAKKPAKSKKAVK